ncbi:MAG: hypothetical protein HY401_09655 [Elusimicrobia bacterium]|nr:hypothetical protein [Elusimicrobiota bacterium]
MINLLDMNQLQILPKLKQYKFLTPNHVLDEVHRRSQRLKLRKAIKAGWLEEFEIADISEIELYAQYRTRFGSGESACMAAAVKRGWTVASDERAVKREITAKLGSNNSLGTRNLLEAAVQANVLDQTRFNELRLGFGL